MAADTVTESKQPPQDLGKMDSNMNKLEAQLTIDDAQQLEQLGHKQELDRRFSLSALVALCLCLMATWEALSTVIAAALLAGGAPCLFYNYVLSFLCTVAIVSSLAEIASVYPTAGGQYHWVAAMSPERSRSSAAWFTGWISIGGQTLLTASAAFAAGLQLQSLIIVNDTSYVPERWQGMLFYWAVLVYSAALNIWGSKLLPHVNNISGIIHVTAFVAILIVLGVMAPKNTPSFVFTEFSNSSGWEQDGVSWLVGLLSTVYPFLGYDAACHLAEEIPKPSRNVPIAMVGSVVVNGLMGLIYVILLLFSTSSLDSLLTTPTGYPFMQIYMDVTQSPAGATVMSLTLIIIAITANVAGITSTSRTMWAFARDKATPYDRYLSKIGETEHVPIRCVVVTLVLQMLLGFLYLGNTTAFNAVLSMAIIAMYISYILPICYMLIHGRRTLGIHKLGSWQLGAVGGVILNIISIIWIIVVIIFSTFPTSIPTTAQTANYSIVVMVGWILFGTIYYIFLGRHKFAVPVVATNVVTGLSVVPH